MNNLLATNLDSQILIDKIKFPDVDYIKILRGLVNIIQEEIEDEEDVNKLSNLVIELKDRHNNKSFYSFKNNVDYYDTNNSNELVFKNVLLSIDNNSLNCNNPINIFNFIKDLRNNNSEPIFIKDLIDTYIDIVNEIITPINNYDNLILNISKKFLQNKNIRILKDIVEILNSKHTPHKTIFDIYLEFYLQAPNSSNKIYNILYFLRQFPLFNFLFYRYISKNYDSLITVIKQYNLEKIPLKNDPYLYHDTNINIENYKKETGVTSLAYEKNIFNFSIPKINIYNCKELIISQNMNNFELFFSHVFENYNFEYAKKISNSILGSFLHDPDKYGIKFSTNDSIKQFYIHDVFKALDNIISINKMLVGIPQNNIFSKTIYPIFVYMYLMLCPSHIYDKFNTMDIETFKNIFTKIILELYYVYQYIFKEPKKYLRNLKLLFKNISVNNANLQEKNDIWVLSTIYFSFILFEYNDAIFTEFNEDNLPIIADVPDEENLLQIKVNQNIQIINCYLYIYTFLKNNNFNLFLLYFFLSTSSDKNKFIYTYNEYENPILYLLEDLFAEEFKNYNNFVFKSKG